MLPGLSAAAMLAGGKLLSFRNLATLFSDGADGIMIDLTDTTTLFQSFNGIGDVVSNGDPVGLALDQRKWAGLTLAAYRDGQPENVSNALVPASWTPSAGTLSSVDDALRITATSASTPAATRSISVENGRWYECSARMKAASGGTANAGVKLGTSSGGAQYVELLLGSSVGAIRRCFFRTTSTTLYIQFVGQGGVGSSCDFDFLSIKEIDGYHATQSGGNRPLWNAATNDVLFNGTSQYLTNNFTYGTGSAFCATFMSNITNSSTRHVVSAYDGVRSFYLGKGSGELVYGYAGNTVLNGTTDIGPSGAGYKSLLVDRKSDLVELVVEGVLEASAVPGLGGNPNVSPFIGARNNNGSAAQYAACNIKRVIAGRFRLQDVMSAADFHENLIAA
jgi:hypothetical protein